MPSVWRRCACEPCAKRASVAAVGCRDRYHSRGGRRFAAGVERGGEGEALLGRRAEREAGEGGRSAVAGGADLAAAERADDDAAADGAVIADVQAEDLVTDDPQGVFDLARSAREGEIEFAERLDGCAGAAG